MEQTLQMGKCCLQVSRKGTVSRKGKVQRAQKLTQQELHSRFRQPGDQTRQKPRSRSPLGRSTIQRAEVTEWHSQCSAQDLGFRVGRSKVYTPAQSSLSFLSLQCGNVYFAGVKPSDGLSETHRRYLMKLQRHPPNQHLLSSQAKAPDKMNWPRISLLWRRQCPCCFEDPSSFGP